MAHSVDIAKMIASIIHDLNPTNYDVVFRKTIMLPVKTRTHLGDIAGEIHVRALARPAQVKLYAALCAHIITGGFDGARSGSGPAFRTALLPRCYDKFKQSCRTTATTRFKQSHVSGRQSDYFETNCVFIGELYRLGVYPDYIVWSFLNNLLNGHSCDVKVRCLCALLSLVAPKLSETYTMTRDMSLKMKKNIEEIKQKYYTDRILEHPDMSTDQRPLINKECFFEPSDENNLQTAEFIQVDTLEILLRMTNKPYLEESYDIERLLTPCLLSSLKRDPASLINSLYRAAFANGDDEMRLAAGVLLADLVNAGRLTKYAVVKGCHVMLNEKELKEQYPDLPDLLQQIRYAFEDRLGEINPVDETLYEAYYQTSQWLDCSLNRDMINAAFFELLAKFGSKIHFKERHDIERLVRPVLVCMLKHGQVNTVVSIIYTAIHSKENSIRVNAGKLLARLVLARRLRKTSVVKGFCKILIDDASSDFFTNIPELLATVRTAFEN